MALWRSPWCTRLFPWTKHQLVSDCKGFHSLPRERHRPQIHNMSDLKLAFLWNIFNETKWVFIEQENFVPSLSTQNRANPKSAILTFQCRDRRMFSHFKSRCATLREWRYWRPWTNWRNQILDWRSGTRPFCLMKSSMSPFSANRMKIKTRGPRCKMLCTYYMHCLQENQTR